MKPRLVIAALMMSAAIALWLVSLPMARVAAPSNTVATKDVASDNAGSLTSASAASARIPRLMTARARPLHGLGSSARALAPAGAPMPLEFTNFSARIVLQNVRHVVRSYGSEFGGNPVGSNVEITRALAGRNPKHIDFLMVDAGLRVDATGKLVDPWGTPYFFHQLSGTEMEIHSAGPDRVMWTQDDLVIK